MSLQRCAKNDPLALALAMSELDCGVRRANDAPASRMQIAGLQGHGCAAASRCTMASLRLSIAIRAALSTHR